nr:MAG TPA: hypothetical protein [Caudoviricetes sp.]
MKNKDKYILNEIVIKATDTLSGHKVEIFYKDKIIYERIYLVETSPKKITDFFNWLEQEYKPPILDDVEKAYLSAVIKPFRNEVECIVKYMFSEEKEFLAICLHNGEEITLPIFIRRTMYKGMKLRKAYTLKELGL